MSYTQESGHEQDYAREQITSGNLIVKLINDVQGCPYFVLELPMKASIADVKKGYEKLAIQHHPDKVMGTEELKKEAKINFQKISNAYQLLIDKHWTNFYDAYADYHVKRERNFFLVYIGKVFTTGITQVVQW